MFIVQATDLQVVELSKGSFTPNTILQLSLKVLKKKKNNYFTKISQLNAKSASEIRRVNEPLKVTQQKSTHLERYIAAHTYIKD